jgi:putative ABC transport system permease protein
VKALTRKLLRDIGNMRGAVFTISLVVAAGIAAFVTLRGTYGSLVATRDRYYAEQRFGEVFLELERAPQTLEDKLEAIPGVSRVYTRIQGVARIPLESLPEPAQARVVSIPDEELPPLNGIHLLAGRMPSSDRDDEALLSEQFAERHEVKPGQVLRVVLEGRERNLRIVGLAMSPEFVLVVPNGASAPSPDRFAVVWMPERSLEAAFDMRGAFNSVVLALTPQTPLGRVIRALDDMFERYGGLGAYGRDRQLSNYFLAQDLAQLATLGTIAPTIFLCVAAFLLNVVLSRLIELDRPQIATLKALGYSASEVGLHYLQLTLIITSIGAVLGTAVGSWLGEKMTGIYVPFYRMPGLTFRMDLQLVGTSLLVSLCAGLIGSFVSVRRVMLLPPAEAMRPAAPPSYHQGWLGRVITQQLSSATRMIAREISRRPLRTVMSALGIGAATGIVVVGQHFSDAMAYIVDFYIQAQQRETIAVEFVDPVDISSVRSFAALPGVRDVQWQSIVQVRVRAEHRERTVALVSHGRRHSLRPLIDADGREVAIERGEVLFTDMLAKVLGVKVGDTVIVEPLQGDRTPRPLTITGTVSELVALWIHMYEPDFENWLGVGPMASSALLVVDQDKIDAVQAELIDMPRVATATRKTLIVDEFRKQQGATISTFALVLTLFAVTISVSVVYNNARVALSMRGRELASLRVLGFTRGEISAVLIGELGVQVLLGIPIGLWFGVQLINVMMAANDPESFRFPNQISDRAFAFASLVTVLAAIGSALLVRRKLDKLDLIEVLKTRE